MDDIGVDKLLLTSQIVSRFENALRADEEVSLEDMIRDVPPQLEDFDSSLSLFQKLLAAEIEFHRQQGDRPEAAAYVNRFPQFQEAIREVFANGADFAPYADSTTLITDFGATDVMPLIDRSDALGSDGAERVREQADQLAEDAQLPQDFGRYKLLRLLGRGGMGSVYLAHDTQLDRRVAIKIPVFRDDSEQTRQAIERFYREARSMATVEHKNICPIYDVGEFNGQPFLSMAYLDGETLADRLRRRDAVSVDQAVSTVATLANALQAAHQAGIVHRDLKPLNVMINSRDEPIVLDFGLAHRDRHTEAEITQNGAVIGSPMYMAPEQVSGRRGAVGPHTDVYALGVMLYQLLCGRRPYEGTTLEVLGDISSGQMPPLPSSLVDVDKQLEAICLKAMAHRIEDRYPSAQDLSNALQDYLAVRVTTPIEKASSRHTSSGVRVAAITGLVAVVVVVAFAIIGGLRNSEDSGAPRPGTTNSTSQVDSPLAARGTPGKVLTLRLLPRPASPSVRTSGAFQDSGQELGNGKSRAARLADLDADGDLDAFVINRYDQPNRVWLNDGHGFFTDSGQELGNSYSWNMAMGDVDADGDMDVAVANSNGQPSRVWINDGEGKFSDHGNTISGSDAHAIGLADLDADGDLDLVLGNTGANSVWKNDGVGRFTDTRQRLGSADTWYFALDDLNGDGTVDVFAANLGRTKGEPNRVWMNDGNGNLIDSGQALGNAPSMSVVLADLNGDDAVDAFVANNKHKPDQVCINDGHGRFTTIDQAEVRPNVHVALGDFDGDGYPDAFVANAGGPRNLVFLNDGEANFVPGPTPELGLSNSSGGAIGDLDGDGDLDVFVTNFRDEPNRVWLNQDNH